MQVSLFLPFGLMAGQGRVVWEAQRGYPLLKFGAQWKSLLQQHTRELTGSSLAFFPFPLVLTGVLGLPLKLKSKRVILQVCYSLKLFRPNKLKKKKPFMCSAQFTRALYCGLKPNSQLIKFFTVAVYFCP